ncbi:uncharacterized protein isoform X2 [Rhodnius prolixus]|uniref:uncharacterized protein isoform X2 n=1 Tax=Rhodnius prolixus TaxID=13249 RepID=UPI003D189401
MLQLEDINLPQVNGLKYTHQTLITDVTKKFRERHFAIPYRNEGESALGPLALFSFIVQTKVEKHPYKQQHQQLKSLLRNHLQDGLLLDAREKGVMFPLVHFTEDRNSLKKRLSDEYLLENDFLLHQGVYREVRNICPEGDIQNLENILPQHVGYILLGFKSIDRNFSQVMVDSWKDWTGARYIYMYLPDELGLARISFYTREAPDSLNMFMYVVLVECRTVNTRERQMKLLDFAQRMRVERMSGYISVYSISMEES